MRVSTRHCDRCPQIILEGGLGLEVKYGVLPGFPGDLDLCPSCLERFGDFLRSGRQADHDGMGQALSDTAVCSMALS
jgi:hypothetical protein